MSLPDGRASAPVYLTDGHVVQDVVFSADVFFGSETREKLEIVNEVGLIIEAAILRNDRPIHLFALLDFADCFLEADDSQISLGSDANLPLEHADKMLLRVAD